MKKTEATKKERLAITALELLLAGIAVAACMIGWVPF